MTRNIVKTTEILDAEIIDAKVDQLVEYAQLTSVQLNFLLDAFIQKLSDRISELINPKLTSAENNEDLNAECLNIYIEKFADDCLKSINTAPMVTPLQVDEENFYANNHWKFITFNSYRAKCESFFMSSSLDEADLAIFPYDWFQIRGYHWFYPIKSPSARYLKQLSFKYYQKVKEKNKKLVIFFSGDRSHEPLPFKDAIVFREGLYQSQRKKSDFILPAFSEDFVEHYLSSSIIKRFKNVKPVVGFCGLAIPRNCTNYFKEVIYHGFMLTTRGELDVSPYKGENLRIKLLNQLKNHPEIETNFLIRDQSVFISDTSASNHRLKKRQEYVQNMLESDYVLCCRGSGNYSYRIYETLCMGRIPIFVNTDCGLPYDFLIDWQKYCVWIEENELDQLPTKLLNFHNSLSPQDFIDLQYKCRELWLKWLSPQGFFGNFYRHFSQL